MTGNGKVFISHAHEDNDRCAPLLAALDAWGVDYWFDTQQMHAGQDLSDRIQKAIADSTIFIRVCTPAAQASFWVGKETGAFIGLQALDHRVVQSGRRTLIPLRLDERYSWQPFELDTIYIDAAGKSQRAWLEELRKALADVIPARQAPETASTSSPDSAQMPAPTADASPLTENLALAIESRLPLAQVSSAPTTYSGRTLVVDATGSAEYRNIKDAIKAAQSGDRIMVHPGIYRDGCTIRTPIEIVGQGKTGEVVLETTTMWAFPVTVCANSVSIKGLTIRAVGRDTDAIWIRSGGTLIVEDCNITASNSGIYVDDGNAFIRHCQISDCGRNGVVIEGSNVGAVLDDNVIIRCASAALHLKSGTKVSARRNLISKNAIGVKIDADGVGDFTDNDVRGNKEGAWQIVLGTLPNVRRERNLE